MLTKVKMRISLREIVDYVRCPLKYKFTHIDQIPVSGDGEEYYKEYLKLSIFYYYFCQLENRTGNFESILKKWESLWFSKDMTESFEEEYLKKKSNDAVVVLTNFYKKMAGEKVTPIAVNFPYEAIFQGDENIHVTGNTDLIRVVNDKTKQRETQIVSFSTSVRVLDNFAFKSDLGITLASYTFRNTFKTKEDKIKVINIKQKNDNITTRSGGDFVRLEKIVRNICRGIKSGVFYPNSNVMNCTYCKHKLFCINEKALR